ncbi:MAG TPA: hypothetical protein VGR28_12970 [Candidatus Thermoplasmatota archaeon]|jgi:hypothetical protein|nr:hypothetical protein [Candidatus Thermoplasmatota archaeon]
MEGTVLTWTRLERPPAGFAPGRVVVLVEAGGERRYAAWEGSALPAIGARVTLSAAGAQWLARAGT